MAPIQKWFARMLPSGATRGLSGDFSALLAVDPQETWYNQRLQCHRADTDFLENPEKLWEAPAIERGTCGLHSHFGTLKADDRLGFTHILVVVSQEDIDDAEEVYGDHWRGDAEAHLLRETRAFLEHTAIRPAFAQQLPRIFVVPDADKDLLDGHRLGLVKGEFVTAMVPNIHRPAVDSDSELVIFLDLPDQPGEFTEVGRLHSDQLMFTIGNHWLDNYRCSDFPGAALYQIHRDPNGGYIQLINPDGADLCRIEHGTVNESADVISIQYKGQGVLARVVLALADKTLELPEATPAPDPSADDPERLEPVPLAPVPTAPKASASPTIHGHLTIVPEVLEETYLTLQETGALLQRIHFKNFMTGYDVYLSSSGHLGTIPCPSVATLKVRRDEVFLQVNTENVIVNDSPVPVGSRIPLVGKMTIEAASRKLEYRDLTGVNCSGWPYLGEIRRPGTSTHLTIGSTNRIGRGRACEVRLPDQHHNENILWRDKEATTVRARSGTVDRGRFHTDSIMVASEHAELDLRGHPRLRSLARHCFTYLRRGEQVLALHPTERDPGPRETEIRDGDEILVGNCLFLVRGEAFSVQDSDSQPPAPSSETNQPLPAQPTQPTPTKSVEARPAVARPAQGSTESNDKEASTSPGTSRLVSWVEESKLESQLAQAVHLCQSGWMVSGEQLLGNHMGASLILPELRMDAHQNTSACEYAHFTVRGRRGRVVNLAPEEVVLYVNGEKQELAETLDGVTMEIHRRDGSGEIDFSVAMHLEMVNGLPNPRARLLVIDNKDPMSKAMLTQGIPPNRPKAIQLGLVHARAHISNGDLIIDEYQETRRDNHGGLIPFYVSRQGGGFRSIGDTGAPITLGESDRILVGGTLYAVLCNT